MKFNILTIFPDIILHYTDFGVLGRARKNNLIRINSVNLRDFTKDKHKTVDDTPYGGGAGMVMKPEPIYMALKSLGAVSFKRHNGISKLKQILNGNFNRKKKTILLSPRGRQFNQRTAEEWKELDEITFICGRYEGVDQRVADYMADEEISIGPYILTGGELGALVIIEAVSRLIPGVLGNAESLENETFNNFCAESDSRSNNEIVREIEYDQYTKPANFMGWKVPDVLLSGDHKKISEWRKRRSV